MFDELQYRLLRKIAPRERDHLSGAAYAGKSKLRMALGNLLPDDLSGKTIIDFGCGTGDDSLELARMGAARVIGLDIREELLEQASNKAQAAGLDRICEFHTPNAHTTSEADLIISIDSFEHFADPAAVLRTMASLLLPNGRVLTSFGPTWRHPYGGHLFSVFPWAHLLFSERALIRWRAHIRNDGATRFGEVAGGLNQMTINRFEELVRASPLREDLLELVPVRNLPRIQNGLTREYITALVRCQLSHRT